MSMVKVGIVTGSTIGPNRHGTRDVRLLQVVISDPEDVQTAEFLSGPGDDSAPELGSKVLLIGPGPAWKAVAACSDTVAPSIDSGERKLYSVLNGVIQAFINLLSDGTLELNGGSDFAVRYTGLESAFNQLKADFDAHTGHSTGGAPPASTADISGAKVTTVRVP